MTADEYKELFELLNMDEQFKTLEYGGTLEQALLILRIPVTTKNTTALEKLFVYGIDEVVTIQEMNGDGVYTNDHDIDEYRVAHTTTSTDEDGHETTTTTYMYQFYRIDKAKLDKLPGEKLMKIVEIGLGVIASNDKPCEFDQIITIIIIIVLAVMYPPAGAYAWAVYTSAAISIGLTLGVWTSKKDQRNLGILAAALGILGGYGEVTTTTVNGEVATISFAEASWKAQANFALTTVGGLTSMYHTQHTYEYDKEMTSLENKISYEEDRLVELMENDMKIMFNDYASMLYRKGHEADPYNYVYEQFDPYSVYEREVMNRDV